MTWSNAQERTRRIWELLDRGLGNFPFHNSYSNAKIVHLPRLSSNHAPLLLERMKQISSYSSAPF
ncbi:hypothetical protein REPUB_Repub19eG0114400 [Reevesia pubescens]